MRRVGSSAARLPGGSARARTLIVVALVVTSGALLTAFVAAANASPATRPSRQAPLIRRRLLPAIDSPCDHPRPGPLAYHWPVKPFDQQHPIRGYFGDPRTLGLERLGSDRQGSPGSFTFHNGVDISAAPGTPVYPVVSGLAHIGSGDRVSVTTSDGRTFQYYHIKPDVQPGQHVTAYRTVLGRVKRVWLHVHLTEIDNFRTHNPLDPGHLEPYRDHTIPLVDKLTFSTESGSPLDPGHLRGTILIAADADDAAPVPVPGHWFGFPVTPALVTWRLATLNGTTLRRGTVADFRHTEPHTRDFWFVYAAGTYQNFPDFTHHLYWHVPGQYLFNLTPRPLDTYRLRNGNYRLTVAVADTCGNRSRLTEQVRVANAKRPLAPSNTSLVAHALQRAPHRPGQTGRPSRAS